MELVSTKSILIEEFYQYAQDSYSCYIACKNKKQFITILKAFGSIGAITAFANLSDLNNEKEAEVWYNNTCHEKNYKGYAYILFFIHGFERGDTNVIFYHTNPLIDKASHDFHKPCGFKTAINIIKKFKKLEKYINVDL